MLRCRLSSVSSAPPGVISATGCNGVPGGGTVGVELELVLGGCGGVKEPDPIEGSGMETACHVDKD